MTTLGHCQSCTWRHHPIPGNGPRPCSLLFLGEGPAKDEIRRGYPFAGRSGYELDDHYLPLAGLRRPGVYVSNVRHCPSPGFRNPTPEEALTCARCHLPAELKEVGPTAIITLGAIAASIFDTVHTPGSLGRDINLETDRGIHTRASFGQWTGWLVPLFHPAAGFRDPRIIQALREDFSRLPSLLRMLEDESDWRLVPKWTDQDKFPSPVYREIATLNDLDRALCFHGRYSPVGVDTESDGKLPWSLQFSLFPGTGYLIDATRRDLISAFRDWVMAYRPELVLHHALHDLGVLLDLDPPISPPRWTDTMMLAYHAQFFSHGLKPLAYRLLGMEMQDYSDVVVPHSIAAVESYALDLVSLFQSTFMVPHVFKSGPRKGQSELRWPPATDTLLRETYNRFTALVRDCQADPRPASFDPWTRYQDWKPEYREWSEGTLGRPFPRSSIAHVPREEAVYYSIRDADAALRLLPIVRASAARFGKDIPTADTLPENFREESRYPQTGVEGELE